MGSRGGEYEREALILSRALVPLWFLSGHPERNSPPQRRNSLREKNPVRNPPPHPPPSGAPDPIPSGLRPSPLDKGSRPPGGRLLGVNAPSILDLSAVFSEILKKKPASHICLAGFLHLEFPTIKYFYVLKNGLLNAYAKVHHKVSNKHMPV